MPIITEWYDAEKTILIYRALGNWDAQDIWQMASDVDRLLEGIHHKIDLVSDFSGAGKPPENLVSITQKLASNQPPQFQRIYVVGMHYYLEIVLDFLSRVYPHHMHNFVTTPTLEETLRLIRQHRMSEAGS